MRLTNDDKVYLLKLGCLEQDFGQIERAAKVTRYEYQDKKINKSKVIKLIGRERWLSGLARSAFHCTAMREEVYFDSSKLWEA